jgi:3',5'-nucleoside bisphosphate phosphatase
MYRVWQSANPPVFKSGTTYRKAARVTHLRPKIEADLHNHTTCSDGEFSPMELVQAASGLGLKALAITDHDTLEGLADGYEQSLLSGIELVCGVEVTLRFTEEIFRGSLHMLLYFGTEFLKNEVFIEQTNRLLALGRGASLTTARIEAINRHFAPGGFEPILPRELKEEDIYRHGHRISRRHFALALEDMGITDRVTISRLLGNDSPAYIPSGVPLGDLRAYLDTWPLIRILAHPAAGSFPGESHYKEVLPPLETVEAILPRFLEIGLDGLEVNYPGHTPGLIERLHAIRRQYDLPLATGGSDCHDKSGRPMGVCGVGYEVVEKMKQLWNLKLKKGEIF